MTPGARSARCAFGAGCMLHACALVMSACAAPAGCEGAQEHQRQKCLKLTDWAERGHCLDDARAELERCPRQPAAGAKGP
jgi:hypothetical protein